MVTKEKWKSSALTHLLFYLQSIKHTKCLKTSQLHTQRKIIIVLIGIVSYYAVKPIFRQLLTNQAVCVYVCVHVVCYIYSQTTHGNMNKLEKQNNSKLILSASSQPPLSILTLTFVQREKILKPYSPEPTPFKKYMQRRWCH